MKAAEDEATAGASAADSEMEKALKKAAEAKKKA